jgi:hypothetical protein
MTTRALEEGLVLFGACGGLLHLRYHLATHPIGRGDLYRPVVVRRTAYKRLPDGIAGVSIVH